MRDGRDAQDTHEPMQMRRAERKYMPGQKPRHLGGNRLKHKGDMPHPVHKNK